MADKQGIVVAVDLGFTSTSRDRRTPIAYMGHEENVLWCLQPQMESDAAYHRGADVSLLSQFSGEQEVVFPPATMFAVRCELGAPAYASDGLCELAKPGTGAAAASEPELEQSGGGKTEPWESHSDDVALRRCNGTQSRASASWPFKSSRRLCRRCSPRRVSVSDSLRIGSWQKWA